MPAHAVHDVGNEGISVARGAGPIGGARNRIQWAQPPTSDMEPCLRISDWRAHLTQKTRRTG